MANIAPAYQASKGSPLDVDKAFYRRIAQELGSRRLIEKLVVPIRSGRAWRVPAGHVFRIVTIDGPQVGDLNIWNLHNPRERMWASRSRQLTGVACQHVRSAVVQPAVSAAAGDDHRRQPRRLRRR